MTDRRLQEMSDRQTGPQQCPETAIERQQFGIGAIRQPVFKSLDQKRPDPWRPQHLAFQAKIVDLVKGIDDAHRPVELEAVDDLGWLAKAHVFGTQVAMTFDDRAAKDACFDPRPQSLQQGVNYVERAGSNVGQREFRLEQDRAVDPLFSNEVTRICAAVVNFNLAMHIEGCQRFGHFVDLGCRQAAAADARVQHIALRQALHFDQPVDDAPAAAEGEMAGYVTAKRKHPPIGFGSKPGVQPQFLATVEVPPRDCAEVEERMPDRLLSL